MENQSSPENEVLNLANGFGVYGGNMKFNTHHMRCDNQYPRSGEEVESVIHANFECPLALQTWALASSPSCPDIIFLYQVFMPIWTTISGGRVQ